MSASDPSLNQALSLAEKNRRLVTRLVMIVVGMFVFAVGILPPMYEVFCEVTGLNGKVALEAAQDPSLAPQSLESDARSVATHSVKVTFVSIVDENIPWTFKPNTRSVILKPGERVETSFFAKNLSNVDTVGHAVPSVTPAQSTAYFKKIECFCFNQQHLAAGESTDMPLIFYLEEDIPEDVKEISLAYTLYPADQS